jgi:hypothetical protein
MCILQIEKQITFKINSAELLFDKYKFQFAMVKKCWKWMEVMATQQNECH